MTELEDWSSIYDEAVFFWIGSGAHLMFFCGRYRGLSADHSPPSGAKVKRKPTSAWLGARFSTRKILLYFFAFVPNK